MIIKIHGVEFIFPNEEKSCDNCFYNEIKNDIPCKDCKQYSNWLHLRRHLYQIIERLQNKKEE